MEAHSEALASQLIERCLLGKHSDSKSAIELIKVGMELVSNLAQLDGLERKKILIAALEIIAKGKDGIAGTDDDMISPETLDMLEILLKRDLVGNLVEMLIDAYKGRLDIKGVKVVFEDATAVAEGCWKWCGSK
jgi:hypothetical protein